MSDKWGDVIKYFLSPANYFWKWADAGNVIEWREGETICYRDDLIPILKKLTRDGWPPLGSVLLLLSACRGAAADDSSMLYAAKQLLNFFDKHRDRFEILAEQKNMMGAIRFLEQVASLPVELRSGAPRVWLLYVIFKNTSAKIDADNTARFLNVFNSGIIDRKVFGEIVSDQTTMVVESVTDGQVKTHLQNTFKDDIDWLTQALKVFPTAKELERVVRTGVPNFPAVAELEVPEQEEGDLLEQLERDPKTTGLAQLTHRLIAALNIPIHAHGSSDQLFGGVSDITNRGNFDRLLLSELAHDDLSLMARLANNEALYLRREELPSNPEKNRILLVDTTIKMWGLPRVFAISAALACAHNNKAKARVMSYALSGNSFTEIDLSTKEGVVSSLEQLDAALHCGRALGLYMDQAKLRPEDEVFLITEEEGVHSVLFQSILSSLKKPLSFLVTVNRNGQLKFYEYTNGRRKQVSEAKFDLQELLFQTNKKKKVTEIGDLPGNLPAIMKEDPCPLFFPASKIRYDTECFYGLSKDVAVCVTIDQRVLYWGRRSRGAREIIQYLEPGRFCFGSIGENIVYVLVYAGPTKYCRLYEANLELNYVEITKLPETLTRVDGMAFEAGIFYIKTNDDVFTVEAATRKVSKDSELSKPDSLIQLYKDRPANLNYFKKLVNDGYTTINKVKSVYINQSGELGFDDRHISFKRHAKMVIIDHNSNDKNKSMRIHNAKEVDAGIAHTNLRFSKFVWSDGSEVLIDSRGLMHLRSSDKLLPEITIVMIMGKPTACWAADGRVCGSVYFTGVDDAESRDVTGFYYNYIQRFIDTLEKHGTIAKV